MAARLVRGAVIALLVALSVVGTPRFAVASGDVEQRIADFWKRVDSLRPTDLLAAADLGQWALNVIERDATARITVLDFRASTAGMQAAMDRAGQGTGPSTPAAGIEQRIAEFWTRVNALAPADHLSSAELGQWALNVTGRNPNARISVSDFRPSTAGMQAAIERAARPPVATPTPVTGGGFDPRFYIGKGDAFNCVHFARQADAQAVLRADPSDPNRLDTDRDGVACEGNRSPKDLVPVRR